MQRLWECSPGGNVIVAYNVVVCPEVIRAQGAVCNQTARSSSIHGSDGTMPAALVCNMECQSKRPPITDNHSLHHMGANQAPNISKCAVTHAGQETLAQPRQHQPAMSDLWPSTLPVNRLQGGTAWLVSRLSSGSEALPKTRGTRHGLLLQTAAASPVYHVCVLAMVNVDVVCKSARPVSNHQQGMRQQSRWQEAGRQHLELPGSTSRTWHQLHLDIPACPRHWSFDEMLRGTQLHPKVSLWCVTPPLVCLWCVTPPLVCHTTLGVSHHPISEFFSHCCAAPSSDR
jgi:hypothetical protein